MKKRQQWKRWWAAGGVCLLAGTLSAQGLDVGDGPATVEDLISLHNQVASDAMEQTPVETAPAERPTILRENLVNNSPFRMVQRGRGPVSNQPLELRGFIGKGDKMEVSLTDSRTKECQWVRVGDPDARWYVESANSYTRTAVVRMDGISLSLEMAQPSETPLTTASQHAPQPAPAVVTAQQPAQQNRPQQVQQQNQQSRQNQQGVQRPQARQQSGRGR